MDCPTASQKQLSLLETIVDFSSRSEGLEVQLIDSSRFAIRQRVDGHTLQVDALRLQDILHRTDSDGRDFVQVNFHDGTKILITDRLIGFKPVVKKSASPSVNQANSKLPRVVTTPDMMSVLEAMEDAIEASALGSERDISSLRELFEAIIRGAEKVGFDVSKEKAWLLPYMSTTPGYRASA